MMVSWILLLLAIFCEVVATSLLKASDGFRLLKLAISALCLYAVSFYFLSLALRSVPLGVAYAIWSGLGIFAVTLIGLFVYQDKINYLGYSGILIIAIGVLLTCFSVQK